jgi:hypothetical protein
VVGCWLKGVMQLAIAKSSKSSVMVFEVVVFKPG